MELIGGGKDAVVLIIGARSGKILVAAEVRCEVGGNTADAEVGLDDIGCIEAIATAIESETN